MKVLKKEVPLTICFFNKREYMKLHMFVSISYVYSMHSYNEHSPLSIWRFLQPKWNIPPPCKINDICSANTCTVAQKLRRLPSLISVVLLSFNHRSSSFPTRCLQGLWFWTIYIYFYFFNIYIYYNMW